MTPTVETSDIGNPKRQYKRRYEGSEKGKINAKLRRNRYLNNSDNIEKHLAREEVHKAIMRDELPSARKNLCFLCGNGARNYHHHKGYSKENSLRVIPLCLKCHEEME